MWRPPCWAALAGRHTRIFKGIDVLSPQRPDAADRLLFFYTEQRLGARRGGSHGRPMEAPL